VARDKKERDMTDIICDACKKPVPGARRDYNYVTFMDKDLCLSCEEKLRLSMRKATFSGKTVIFKDYQETLAKNLHKMVGSR
jgi:hypothetical protein